MEPNKSVPPFFIVGAQRSGTTLLRLILNNHSQVAIPEEARFLTPFLKKKHLNTPLSDKDLINAIKYLSLNTQYKQWNYDSTPVLEELRRNKKITVRELINHLYSSFSASEEKTIWADKSLFFRQIDILSSLFPEAKFIHLVRDGRDVFHSWRKMDKSKNNVATTALDWNYKLYRIEKSFSKLPDSRKLTIRYEDLLEHPDGTVKKICKYIGVTFEPGMLDYHKTSNHYIGKHHSDLIFKSIDSTNMYKWKQNLSNIEIRAYEMLSGQHLKKHNYPLSGEKNIPLDSIYIIYRLLTGIPYRLFQVLSIRFINEIALKRGTVSNVDAGEIPEKKVNHKNQS